MAEKTIPWWRKALEFALGGFRSGFGLFSRLAVPEPVPEPMISPSFRENREEESTLTVPSRKTKPVVAAPEVSAAPVVKSGLMEESVAVVEEAPPAEPAPVPAPSIDKTVPSNPVPDGAAEELSAESNSSPAAVEAVSEAIPELLEHTEPVVEAEAVKESYEELMEEAETELEAEAPVEPEVAETPEDQAVNEDAEKPVEEPEPVINAELEPVVEMAPAPAIETVALDAEPPLEAEPPVVAEPEPTPEPIAAPVQAAVAVPQRALKPQPSAEEKEAARKAARQKKLDEGSEESPFSVIVGQVYDGPLDLLLDLIRKQDIDIYDIPIAIITSQFLAYVNQLRASDVDVAGDFIYTASLLIHIKSKMLLPHAETGPEAATEDPRRELVERLLEHERFKNAAQMLLEKQMLEAATWSNPGAREFKDDEAAEPEIAADTVDLVRIFREILERARNRPVINVEEDSVTVGQMIQFLARRLTMEDKPVALRRLLSHTRSERALIAMFLALLEMVRLQAILLRQDRQFSEIFIKKHNNFDTVMNEGLGNARDDWR
jgi:segregation and condensation protein A